MALVRCPDCDKEISDRAQSCPNCGAPRTGQAPIQAASLAAAPAASSGSGTTCPFSGHLIPDGATVCVCGAYYGYKDSKTPRNFKVGLALSGAALLAFLSGGPGLIVGVLFGLVGVPLAVSSQLAMRKGMQWWRSF